MSDVFDEIIDRLAPSTVKLILEFNNDRTDQSINFNNLLFDIQRLKIKQTNRELERKIFDIKSKTAENEGYLEKFKKDLENLRSLKKTTINEQSVKAYASKIIELESKVNSLTKYYNGIDLERLFNEVEDLSKQIEDYKKKISEAKKKCQDYDGFPADVEQGKQIITKIKERIKENEAIVESLFQT